MKKVFIISTMLAMAIFCFNLKSFAQTVPTKTLCDFFASYTPDLNGSSLTIHYDARNYNEKWFEPAQRNRGGVKFAVELGFWTTPEERDSIVSTIESVTYKNLTKGAIYKFGYPYNPKYVWVRPDGVLSYGAWYGMWLGNANNFIGQWEIEIIEKRLDSRRKITKNTYSTKLNLTEEMILDYPSTAPIEDIVIEEKEDGYQVCFPPSIANRFRVRIIEGGDVTYDSPFIYGPPLCHTIPSEHYGKLGRIESILNYGYILACPNNLITMGSQSRECSHFLLVP